MGPEDGGTGVGGLGMCRGEARGAAGLAGRGLG